MDSTGREIQVDRSRGRKKDGCRRVSPVVADKDLFEANSGLAVDISIFHPGADGYHGLVVSRTLLA